MLERILLRERVLNLENNFLCFIYPSHHKTETFLHKKYAKTYTIFVIISIYLSKGLQICYVGFLNYIERWIYYVINKLF